MRRYLYVWIRSLTPWLGSLAPWLWALQFRRCHGRWPRRASAHQGPFTDFIFHHKARLRGYVEKFLTDKETAKIAARGLTVKVKTAQTFAVVRTLAELRTFAGSRIGQALIRVAVKPTHLAGEVQFCRTISELNVEAAAKWLRTDYSLHAGEMQYRELEPKIIFEEDLRVAGGAETDGLVDYKFFCVRGTVVFAQVNLGRFKVHRILWVDPSYAALSVGLARYPQPVTPHSRPSAWPQMLEAAAELSRSLDFVRIDLYDIAGYAYFGEFSFTPSAGCEPFSDPRFDQWLGSVVSGRNGVNIPREFYCGGK